MDSVRHSCAWTSLELRVHRFSLYDTDIDNGGSPLIENCDVENEEGMERSGNLSSFSLNTDDLEYQTYINDFRILIPNGWGLYEASLEGGHQRARSNSSSSSPNMLDLGFVEEYLYENDSEREENI